MRHTHATLLLESGESVVYVAERLGDTVETIVETYAHATPKMRDRPGPAGRSRPTEPRRQPVGRGRSDHGGRAVVR